MMEIVVKDDGVGAEVHSITDLTSRKLGTSTGIGMKNVVKRLQRYAGATVTASGKIGEGLEITIIIPNEIAVNNLINGG